MAPQAPRRPVPKLTSHSAISAGAQDPSSCRALLQRWIRAPTTPQRVAQRSCIVLLSLDGIRTRDIASSLEVSPATVRLWTKRFAEGGPEALRHDAPGRGRHARMGAVSMCERLREAGLLRSDGMPLSVRRAAAVLGVSATSVWRAFNQPMRPDSPRPKDPRDQS